MPKNKTTLPGVGVLGQVDLVCTERWSVLPEDTKEHRQPECEAVVDEDDNRPADKEGESCWEDAWVEALDDGVAKKKTFKQHRRIKRSCTSRCLPATGPDSQNTEKVVVGEGVPRFPLHF